MGLFQVNIVCSSSILQIFSIFHFYVINLDDEQLLSAVKYALQHSQTGQQTLNETWHELVNLLGNPASFLERGRQSVIGFT